MLFGLLVNFPQVPIALPVHEKAFSGTLNRNSNGNSNTSNNNNSDSNGNTFRLQPRFGAGRELVSAGVGCAEWKVGRGAPSDPLSV